MDRESPAVKGWKSWKFQYGSMSVSVETTIDSELATQLERHIEELAYGGWSERKPNLDDYEAKE